MLVSGGTVTNRCSNRHEHSTQSRSVLCGPPYTDTVGAQHAPKQAHDQLDDLGVLVFRVTVLAQREDLAGNRLGESCDATQLRHKLDSCSHTTCTVTPCLDHDAPWLAKKKQRNPYPSRDAGLRNPA